MQLPNTNTTPFRHCLLRARYARSLLSPNSRAISPFSAISLSTLSAVFIASTPAGTPQYVVAWMIASRISSSDKPLFLAPRMCTANSGARLRAISMPMLMRDLCCLVSPGRVLYGQKSSLVAWKVKTVGFIVCCWDLEGHRYSLTMRSPNTTLSQALGRHERTV